MPLQCEAGDLHASDRAWVFTQERVNRVFNLGALVVEVGAAGTDQIVERAVAARDGPTESAEVRPSGSCAAPTSGLKAAQSATDQVSSK
jgi:hypothetical protein